MLKVSKSTLIFLYSKCVSVTVPPIPSLFHPPILHSLDPRIEIPATSFAAQNSPQFRTALPTLARTVVSHPLSTEAPQEHIGQNLRWPHQPIDYIIFGTAFLSAVISPTLSARTLPSPSWNYSPPAIRNNDKLPRISTSGSRKRKTTEAYHPQNGKDSRPWEYCDWHVVLSVLHTAGEKTPYESWKNKCYEKADYIYIYIHTKRYWTIQKRNA